MLRPARSAFALLAAMLLAPPASAVLTAQDLLAPGDGLLTHDSKTGRVWLDVTETTNLSWNDVVGGAGGWVGSGWRHGTPAEVCDLSDQHGMFLSVCPGASGLFDYPSPTWVSLMGVTQVDPALGIAISSGVYDDGDASLVGLASALISISTLSGGVDIGADVLAPTDASLELGHLLLRTRCADGVDDDHDGLVDLADPDCTDAQDDSEWHLTRGDLLVFDGGSTADAVYRIDPGTGEATVLASPVHDAGGVALGPDGAVYGFEAWNPASGSALARIDLASGAVTQVGSTTSFAKLAMAVTADGRVFYGSDASSLRSVDIATGVDTLVSSAGLLDDILDVLVEPSGTVLVATGTNLLVGGDALLVRVDPSDGSQTQLAAFGTVYLAGIDFDANGDVIVASGGNPFSAVGSEFFRVPMPAGGTPIQLTSGTGPVALGGAGLIVEGDGSWVVAGYDGVGQGLFRFPAGGGPPVLLTGAFSASSFIAPVRPPAGVGGPAACANGIDDDADGDVDLADAQCSGPADDREGPNRSCGLGVELVVVLPACWLVRRRRRGAA